MKLQASVLAIFLLLQISFSFSQGLPRFTEEIEPALHEKSYPADPDAQAAILIDEYKCKFDFRKDARLVTTHRRRIKFYTEPDETWANIEIPYYENKKKGEKITDIEAYVWIEKEGEIKRYALNPADEIFTDEVSEHWRIKKFALPRVVEGAVVEYKYTKSSPFFQSFEWKIQQDIPVEWSDFKFDLRSSIHYQTELQRVPEFEIEKIRLLPKVKYAGDYAYKENRFHWALKEIPAFQEEPFITTREDYAIKVKFQLDQNTSSFFVNTSKSRAWINFTNRVLGHSSWEDYGKKVGKEEIPAYVYELSEEKKAREIYNLVCQRMTYNGRGSIIPSQSVKDLLKNRTGNSADINVLLCNMLKTVGMEAHPILLSTREHGQLNEDFPFIDDFNYTLAFVKLEKNAYILDATSELRPFGLIPTACMNGKGLMLVENEPLWIELDRGLSGIQKNYVHLQYKAEEDLFVAKVRQVYEGIDGVIQRASFLEDSTQFVADILDGEIEEFRVKNLHDIDKRFEVRFTCEWPTVEVGNKILISPFYLTQIHYNPFESPERNFPIDFNYQKLKNLYFNYNLHDDFEIVSLPDTMNISVADEHVSYMVETGGIKGFNLEFVEKFHLTQSKIDAEFYTGVKVLYDQRVMKNAEHIVLRKMK